jgi:hypothetical protein
MPEFFTPLHHGCTIKFDNDNQRLYWVVFGHNPNDDPIGNFHEVSRFFGILNAVPNGLIWYYTERAITGDPIGYYEKYISDIEFNDNPESDIFYLSKLNRIEVWKVTPFDPEKKVDSILQIDADPIYGECEYGPCVVKFGKMLYVHNGDIRQLIVLPYKYPMEPIDPNPYPLAYVLSWDLGSEENITVNSFRAASQKISDAVFTNPADGIYNLILAYAPDINDHLISGTTPTDLAIYHCNSTQNNYIFDEAMLTESVSSPLSENDINTSLKLLISSTNPLTLLIGKKDEVAKIVYENSDYHMQQPEIVAESNIFRSGLTAFSKSFFLNAVKNGIERFNGSQFADRIPLGYPVYNIAGNLDGSILYFFNTLQSNGQGLYIYKNGAAININEDTPSSNNIEKAIGDCIYNPFENHFLISEYADFGPSSPAIIRVISSDATNSFVQDIELNDGINDYQYAKEMFISPQGKLYVMANMHREQSTDLPNIKILEFTAEDSESGPAYSFLRTFEVLMPTVSDASESYSAHFCYNSRNQSLYVSVNPIETLLDPYNSVTNNIFDFNVPEDNESETGTFIEICNDEITFSEPLNYPGKIICPESYNSQNPSQFDGYIYIIGKKFYRYDCKLKNILPDPDNEPFNDITYSPKYDRLIAIREGQEGYSSDRKCIIYNIENINGNITFDAFDQEIKGQVSNISNNPYDGQMYIYRKIDNIKRGFEPVRIYSFDPGMENLQFSYTNLSFTNLFPDIDHSSNNFFFLYNITKPYFDPVNNYIYYPNGGNSSVTRVSFEPDESFPLNPSGFTWLSFPRLLNRNPNPTVNQVLGEYIQYVRNIEPSNYLPRDSWLQNLPPQYDLPIESVYNGLTWPSVAGLSNIDTKYGYKLNLSYDPYPEKIWLHIYGTVLPADASLTIYRHYDNWIGYWLYETQSPFDAFPSFVLDQVSAIIAQNWMCSKYAIIRDGNGVGIPVWFCACHEGRVELMYGDMVILQNPDGGSGQFDFQWQRYGNPAFGLDRPEAEHFQYT